MTYPMVTDTPEGAVVEGRHCPRCDHDEVTVMCKSPEGNVWEIYLCSYCHYSWRSNEAEELQDPKLYNPKFKLNRKEIENMMVLPPVPDRQ
jgi:hypothetical protein